MSSESPGLAPVEGPIRPARGTHGAVVAPHHLATTAGLEMLRAGGSAVDAAIAANAVLAVVYPSACGLGGDAFWLIWDPLTARELGLNGSGRSAASADPAELARRGLREIPLRGGLAATVPGAVRSWGEAHDRFGRLSRRAVLEPAIELAGDGFAAWEGFIDAVERSAPVFGEALGADASWFATYRPAGRPWRRGERVRQPRLSATLGRIAEHGWDELYEGETARSLASTLAASGSAIGPGDLAAHLVDWTEPIAADYRGVQVTTHPPNSQGFAALEILNVLARFEPPARALFAEGRGGDLRWVHLGVEAAKLAMADRDAYLTDPAVSPAPIERLLSPDHAESLARRIEAHHAARPEARPTPRGGGTVWIGAVDGDGGAVSLIQSNYMTFGCGVVDQESGIVLQNRGAYFSLDPDAPNVLAPSKRTLHTLMPGMLLRDSRPWVVLGSMGGDAQPQIHAQVVSALVDGGLDIAAAVAMPRWFVEPERHFAPPVTVRAEPRFHADLLDGLRALGHPVSATAPFDSLLGHCHGIVLVEGGPAAGGTLEAATDPRSAGLPAAW